MVCLRLCKGCTRVPPAQSVTQLAASALKIAKRLGIALQVERVSCLSSCEPGHSALIETEDGVLRLRGVATAAHAVAAVQHGPAAIAGDVVAEALAPLVLSRMRWADLD